MRWLMALALPLVMGSSIAKAEPRCDSPGVAQMIVPGMIAKNPSANKLGFEVESVTLIGAESNGGCTVWVETNRDVAIKYRFEYRSGSASLDMIDVMSR
jgi:hypothetical protein